MSTASEGNAGGKTAVHELLPPCMRYTLIHPRSPDFSLLLPLPAAGWEEGVRNREYSEIKHAMNSQRKERKRDVTHRNALPAPRSLDPAILASCLLCSLRAVRLLCQEDGTCILIHASLLHIPPVTTLIVTLGMHVAFAGSEERKLPASAALSQQGDKGRGMRQADKSHRQQTRDRDWGMARSPEA